MYFENGDAVYPIEDDVLVRVAVSFNGARRATTFPFTGLVDGDVLTMMSKAFTTTHHGETDTQEGVPVIQGTGFDEQWQYRCVWDHNQDDASYQPAVWVDDEHVKCAEFPPAEWSGERLQVQYDGGEQFNIHIHLEFKLASQGDDAWRYLEFADGGDGPTFPYDFGRCTDDIQNGGEYLVDCGNRAGCGRCPGDSIGEDGQCDGKDECQGEMQCADGKCIKRLGELYSGETQSTCKGAYDNGGTTTGLYQLTDGPDKLVWCEQEMVGGGWTLIAKLPSGDVGHWMHGGNAWTTGRAAFGSITSTGEYRNEGGSNRHNDFKSAKANNMRFSQVLTSFGSYNNHRGHVHNVGGHKHLWELVNSRTNHAGPGRGWFQGWGAKYNGNGHCWSEQPHCNHNGWNMRTSHDRCRFGWTGNNEGNCNSNDSGFGFGCQIRYRGGWSSGWRSAWHCNLNILRTGWIWVR